MCQLILDQQQARDRQPPAWLLPQGARLIVSTERCALLTFQEVQDFVCITGAALSLSMCCSEGRRLRCLCFSCFKPILKQSLSGLCRYVH